MSHERYNNRRLAEKERKHLRELLASAEILREQLKLEMSPKFYGLEKRREEELREKIFDWRDAKSRLNI